MHRPAMSLVAVLVLLFSVVFPTLKILALSGSLFPAVVAAVHIKPIWVHSQIPRRHTFLSSRALISLEDSSRPLRITRWEVGGGQLK
jgi:hypothetical protein